MIYTAMRCIYTILNIRIHGTDWLYYRLLPADISFYVGGSRKPQNGWVFDLYKLDTSNGHNYDNLYPRFYKCERLCIGYHLMPDHFHNVHSNLLSWTPTVSWNYMVSAVTSSIAKGGLSRGQVLQMFVVPSFHEYQNILIEQSSVAGTTGY